MPRRKQFGKRKLHPNQFSDCELLNASASKRKLNSSENLFSEDVENSGDLCYEQNTNVIVDINILRTLLNAISKCKQCNSSNCFDVLEEVNSRKGLVTSLHYICKSCGYSTSAMTSNISKTGYDINTRLVYAFRCIGKGKTAARAFCAVMNLPPPPAKFEHFNNSLSTALEKLCSKSMTKAVEGAVSINDNVRDISVTLDGRGRLTDAEILLIQKYYGLAIRRNASKSVTEMSKSIWAIYFHKLSTNAKPQHGLCPLGSDSWCGYNRSLITGDNRIEVLKHLGIAPGRNTCEALKKIDILRIKEAEIMHQKVSKEARTLKRHKKRVSEAQEMLQQDERSIAEEGDIGPKESNNFTKQEVLGSMATESNFVAKFIAPFERNARQ
ncbi:hypothetical protein HNY73_010353 [Argiope bruennichi]|uniref:Mutator-like transposase domain-containing protein n=1 Tax=Argiope bruennichi TaxID=94029 RepID=A0A8T0F5M9_ARGBR|nr:hypothetical protein HNY73_010353 [Argiope bruennichi]